MQFSVIVCLVICSLFTITHSVIQYKVRGPPVPSRLNHVHQSHMHQSQHSYNPHYTKAKWPMPPRSPARPHPHVRPIPVHMASYKVPVIARPPKNHQQSALLFPSPVWKTPTAVYRPSMDKPFLTSPPISQQLSQQQYEFHINKEPIASTPTIRQVGEKGPIHTIPAPNLSPADKPNTIREEPAQKHTYHYTKEPEISPNSLLGAQALPLMQHQYQVTENQESIDQHAPQNAFTGQKIYFAPDPDPSSILQKLSQYPVADTSALNNVKLFSSELYSPQQLNAGSLPALSSQELYQLLNGAPQQTLVDSYGMPIMEQYISQPQQQAQALPSQNYQLNLNPHQLAQPEPSYYNQISDTMSQQIKDNFKPQFHTFNYEEQSANPPRKEFVQSRVTADLSFEPEVAETYPKPSVQNPNEALAQTQYIQQYFSNRDDNNVSENELGNEQEGSTKTGQILGQLSATNDISPSMFYASLPNKKAAETLATLQAAGSLNSNLLKQQIAEEDPNSSHRESMRIFVPDEEESYEDLEPQASGEKTGVSKAENSHSQGIRVYETTKQNVNSRSDASIEYEDYSGEDNSSSSETQNANESTQFGDKIKAKNTR